MTDITIHVDAKRGSDSNGGLTPETAVRTAEHGHTLWAAAIPGASGNVWLAFKRGQLHNLTSGPLVVGYANNHPDPTKSIGFIEYGEGPDRAWLTGCTRVTGFRKTGIRGIVEATAPSQVLDPNNGQVQDVWIDGNFPLTRAQIGNQYYRVTSWNEGAKTVRINSLLVPDVDDNAGLIMAIQQGWNQSYLRVSTIVPAGGGFHDVSFIDPNAEFIKGGTDTSFPFGPFHQTYQRFHWEGRREFMSVDGNYYPSVWHYADGTLAIGLPPGIRNAAQLDDIGVYISNGVETGVIVSGDDGDHKVRNFVFKVGMKFFGYDQPFTESYVGYFSGASFYESSPGVLGFRTQPAAATFYMCENLTIQNAWIRDAIIGVRIIGGIDGGKITHNILHDLKSSGILQNIGAPYDDMPESGQNRRLHVDNNLIVDTGTVYPGGALALGSMAHASVFHNTITRNTYFGILLGTGSRLHGGWPRDAECFGNDISHVMTLVVDGGGIYVTANFRGIRQIQPIPMHPQGLTVDVRANRIRSVYDSGFDPLGGHAAAIYCDLGTQGAVIRLNHVYGVSVYMTENCTGANRWADNRVEFAIKQEHIAYSGFQDTSDYGGVFRATQYFPPINNPPTGSIVLEPRWKGLWSSVTAYSTGDVVVHYDGYNWFGYLAIDSGTNQIPTAPASTYWARYNPDYDTDKFAGTGAYTGRGMNTQTAFTDVAQFWKAGTPATGYVSEFGVWYQSTSIRTNNGPDVLVPMNWGCDQRVLDAFREAGLTL